MHLSELPPERDDSDEETEGNGRDGDELVVKGINQAWECDATFADLLLVDQHGEPLGRPWLTAIVDPYSRCIMGINLEVHTGISE